MDWLILFFTILSITGIIMVFRGMKNKSLALTLSGGGALLAPLLFFNHLGPLLPMIPPTVLGILYLTQRKWDSA